MKLESKKYTLFDYIRIPCKIAPKMVSIQVINKIINAIIPSLKVVITAYFIDTSISIYNGKATKEDLIPPLIYIFLVIAYQYISSAVITLVRERVNINLVEVYKIAILEKHANLQYSHIENNDTLELINRVGMNSVQWIGYGYNFLLYMFELFFRIGSILFVLAVQVWWAAIAIFTFSIPLFMLAIKSGKVTYEVSKEVAKHNRRAQYFEELLTGRDNVEERTLFGYSKKIIDDWSEKYISSYKAHFAAERQRTIKMKCGSMITLLINFLIIGALIAPVSMGKISIGMFMGLVSATFSLVQAMSWELAYITSELAKHKEFLHEFTIFSKLSETEGATDLPVESVPTVNCIEFRHVSFQYPGTKRKIINDLNLKIMSHKHYAFVGANGAGKTTITKLLTGLYDNYEGEILIDGKNLSNFTQAQIKSIFSIVYQDYAKYQISMKDCISIGNAKGVSDKKLEQVVQLLGLDSVVNKLPNGINTPLGKIIKDSSDISGGEWQRVAIARSLVSDASVHIFDEPTAALDPVAESSIYEMFGKASINKTTIFITHRLGAARLADIIFVIDDGHVVEEGTHDELLQKDGVYGEMYKSQRGWYV